jgi:hypothetical protein
MKRDKNRQKTPSEKNVPKCSFVYLHICFLSKEITASRQVRLHQFCVCAQTLLLLLNCLGAFPGTIHGIGVKVFTFKLLPNNRDVLSTGAYHQQVSKEKAKGSLRPLAKAGADWAYAMSLPSLSELDAAMVFLFFLAGLSLCLTFSAAFLCAGGGGAKKVAKASLQLLNE